MHYETSAIARTLERNVFLDAEKRFARVIRRPAPQNWEAPGRAHFVHPPGALSPPSVDGVVSRGRPPLAGRAAALTRISVMVTAWSGVSISPLWLWRDHPETQRPRRWPWIPPWRIAASIPACCRAPESCQHAVDEGVLAVSLPESCFGGVVDECQPAVRQSFSQGEERPELGVDLQGVDEGSA